MPGFSYSDIAAIFRQGGRVLGRPWGRRYASELGCVDHVPATGQLMPDCSDYHVEAGYVPPCPPRCRQSKPVRLRVLG